MFLVNLLVALLLTLTIAPSHAQTQDAPEVDGNPNLTYKARLGNTTSPRGVLTITAAPDGVGVEVHVDFWDFPAEYIGPYAYHIHQARVPDDGNCTATLGHFDPYNRGMTPKCNDSAPETCQLGDLSGKHGYITAANITGNHYRYNYTDDYLSTKRGDPAFFGNLSLVVHAGNDARLNCGNFNCLPASTPTPTPASTPTQQSTASLYPAGTSSPPLFVGAASSLGGTSLAAMLMALAAFFL
ncbi:Superoxide dismutase, copper/zinc binding domain containing protein [Elaphomyces granulatus]